VRVLATHSIRQFPLHFPSRASPCATSFRTSSTLRRVICISHSECVSVALTIHYEMRKCRIILSLVAYLALSCCSTLSHKRDDLKKKLLIIKGLL